MMPNSIRDFLYPQTGYEGLNSMIRIYQLEKLVKKIDQHFFGGDDNSI